ncbi:MAG: M20/M25/M40 family metallo-hydrolase [Oscillospiraceae bacterium]|jgi:carboxypeptidase PM20D1|nr:M20/M25/M40 family metallo-hydrolase [Oscillospiraceae bacterium]
MELWQYILYGVGALLCAFVVVTLIRAAFFNEKKLDLPPLPDEDVDVDRALESLSSAIQIPTISYPEHEKVDWAQFAAFREFLVERYPRITQTLTRELVGEASVLYRWAGTDPSLDPIALLSHQDVVPVTPGTEGDWTHPPFSGHNDGEFLWGRGSLDMKNHLICVMEAVEKLIAEGFTPARDVYLCFGHDEEVVASDAAGAKSIAELLKSRGIHLDSVIDEGGAWLKANVPHVLNDRWLAGIGISEKGYVDFEISVAAKGGHSSAPPNHSALGELAVAIADVEKHQFKPKLFPFMTQLLANVGRAGTYPVKLLLCNVWLLKPVIKAVMRRIPMAACMVRTTTAATMAEGSPACNVLPQKASAIFNFRMMPGTTIADVERHLHRVIRNKNVQIQFVKGKEASPFSPTDSRAFKVMAELCKQMNANSIVAPYLVMGGTDACFYEIVCENVNRFSPFEITAELMGCTHATNERIPIATVGGGVAFFKRYIRKLANNE